MFPSAWQAWWVAINPPWRCVEGDLVRKGNGDFKVLECPGLNRFLNIIACLKWWRMALDTKSAEWKDAVADVMWVLKQMTRAVGAPPRGGVGGAVGAPPNAAAAQHCCKRHVNALLPNNAVGTDGPPPNATASATVPSPTADTATSHSVPAAVDGNSTLDHSSKRAARIGKTAANRRAAKAEAALGRKKGIEGGAGRYRQPCTTGPN
ncbi:hypothetical protein MSAN_02028200 [Mycena sanguinolenta]|uniref:Uncharacterized protein n=1 Tax=Mycena sanguinolenta TaxID=230812 RepID=A0A8H7CPF2_9AGAR|nr:hypothetical protein MSAN_02028200 [Mycena sanguinolenta]